MGAWFHDDGRLSISGNCVWGWDQVSIDDAYGLSYFLMYRYAYDK